ncbi:MAG: hypothetical protein GF393_08475 [Armatimonadia bacterium]|nr:hypothetical protein [Armatimonadia bacterium]
MGIPAVYTLWNLLWPFALMVGVIWAVGRYRRWADHTELDPRVRRRIFIGLIVALVAYAALRPEVPIRFAQYVWPPHVFYRTMDDYVSRGRAVGWDTVIEQTGLQFPRSARLRAADRHSWLEGCTRARVTMATTDVPELIASVPDLEPMNGDEPRLDMASPWAPMWWAPRPAQADGVWRAEWGLQVTEHRGRFGRSTVFISEYGR